MNLFTGSRVALGAFGLSAGVVASASAQAVDVIAFGSCARERMAQPVWDEILEQDPDVFLFIGDNQYADFWLEGGRMVMKPIPHIERLHEAYAVLGSQPGFRRARAQTVMMATWDDHDYGANDAGKEFEFREQSREVFMDFYGFSQDDPIRAHEGIYHSRVFEGDGKTLRIIMLDTRYNRDALERRKMAGARGPYGPTRDTSKTILGEAQWSWLEGELRRDADVRIIATSIQVIADQHGYETWGNFPHERERLYSLIAETEAEGVVFVSGDRHLIEISRDTPEAVPYPIWDFTSSGMTQAKGAANDPNDHRVGPVYRETNFGVVRIDWGERPETTAIHLEGYGDESQLLNRQTVWLSELQIED